MTLLTMRSPSLAPVRLQHPQLITPGAGRILLLQDFSNYANTTSGLGTPEIGEKWRYIYNTPGRTIISSGQSLMNSTNMEMPYVDVKCRNIEIEVVMSVFVNGIYPINFRFLDTNNFFSLRTEGSNKYRLYKRVASSTTSLESYSVVPANGDRIKVTIKNNLIIIYLNNVPIMQTIDSSLDYVTSVALFGNNGTIQNAAYSYIRVREI
jgi:hypothetical protein